MNLSNFSLSLIHIPKFNLLFLSKSHYLNTCQRQLKQFLIIDIRVYLIICSCFSLNTVWSQDSRTFYPSDIIPFMNKWSILLGDGSSSKKITDYQKEGFFYTTKDESNNWVVFKAPNSGITSKNSSNTRSELGQIKRWTPETGGQLSATLKVMHVSTTGDSRSAASYSVVIGQIHSDEGHENEPLKIFYKKFPGHSKGSVFWNYEINTKGDNAKRWDYSTPVWGYDMSIVGSSKNQYPPEPIDGIALGEEFSYEIKVIDGIMYLSFTRANNPPKTFVKNLTNSSFSTKDNIPNQVLELYSSIGRDGIERSEAYAGERQFFKLGAYNQSNGKSPNDNIVWHTGSKTFDGDISLQYQNGSYVEVWFRKVSLE